MDWKARNARIDKARKVAQEAFRTATGNSLQRRAAVKRAIREAGYDDIPDYEIQPPKGRTDLTVTQFPSTWGSFAKRRYAETHRF